MEMLVTTGWLAGELAGDGRGDAHPAGGGLVVLDASLHLPAAGRDAAAEYRAGHIPSARFLDLATLVDPGGTLDNAFPDEETVTARLRALGVSAGGRIVLYDDSPLRSAARGWFVLTAFGARDVAILDGGLAKWKAEGRPLAQGEEPAAAAGDFTARLDRAALRDIAAVRRAVDTGGEQIVDARSAARFSGAEGEPRPGMAAGHVPGAANLPIGMLYAADGTMKGEADLAAEFAAAGVDPDRPVITMCGSGITASVLNFALARLGRRDVALYDGSWAEWGGDPATPKAAGLPHADNRPTGSA